ncbi:MAG: hypothetical protein AAFO06_04575 [Cyanobacteria bacterium J06597_16]
MTALVMKIPANGATRLSTQTWVEAEALKRFMGVASVRKTIEKVVSDVVTENLNDPEFIAVLKQVRDEGIDDD